VTTGFLPRGLQGGAPILAGAPRIAKALAGVASLP